MYDLKLITNKRITYLTSPALQKMSIICAFTTRFSGVSNSPFNSLNTAFNVGDTVENVKKNRQLIANSLGFDYRKLTCAQQVHGNNIKIIEDKEVGAGYESYDRAILKTDGLLTLRKNVPITMFFADCLPVVLVSFRPKIVAVIHAGYRGLLNSIVLKSLITLTKFSDVQNVSAFLGPSIGPCCYKVDSKRIRLFKEQFPDIIDKNESFLDLKKIAIYQLKKAGLCEERIFSNNYCTYCNKNLFFSFRRNKTTGRQAAIAYISEC